MKLNYITGSVHTPAGDVPKVTTKLNFHDLFGTLMVRWSINRDNYKVDPGLYAIGTPGKSSDVFVTANYKLTFDHVRKNLDGLNAWILVLDTKGVNVWCAAGKGVFSTTELINRIHLTSLDKIINHHRLILPQLGATGISAYKVKELTQDAPGNMMNLKSNTANMHEIFAAGNLQFKPNPGYAVIYGPVRAVDIKAFVSAGYKATREMRKVNFGFTDRAMLIPVDFVSGKLYLLAALTIIFIISGIGSTGISLHQALDHGFPAMLNILLAYTAGIVFTPILLPYLPGRTFSLKGCISGLILSVILFLTGMIGTSFPEAISWVLIITAISSFLSMNFTGSSTYTSLSGVKKEMKLAVPFQISFSALGLIILVISKFI